MSVTVEYTKTKLNEFIRERSQKVFKIKQGNLDVIW